MPVTTCQNLRGELGEIKALKAAYDEALKDGSKTGDYSQAQTLKNQLEQSLKAIEQKIDPEEYKLRDQLAKKFGFQYIAKFNPEGLAIAEPRGGNNSGNNPVLMDPGINAFLINREGEIIHQAYRIYQNENGFYTVKQIGGTSENLTTYSILKPDGTPLLSEPLSEVGAFSDGLAWIRKKGSENWSIVNEKGEVIQTDLTEGSDLIIQGNFKDGICLATKYARAGTGVSDVLYVNSEGKTIAKRSDVDFATKAGIILHEPSDGYGLIEKIDIIRERVAYTLVNRYGKIIKFKNYAKWITSGFRNGLACVEGQWFHKKYFIDTNDQKASQDYNEVWADKPPILAQRNKKWFILKKNLNLIEEIGLPVPPNSHIKYEFPGLISVRPKGETTTLYFNENGEQVLKNKFTADGVEDGGEGTYLATGQATGLCFFLKPNGEEMFNETFDKVYQAFHNGVAKVSKNGEVYYIDKKGRRIFS